MNCAQFSLAVPFRRGKKHRLEELNPKSEQRQRHEQTINSAAASRAGTHSISSPLSMPFTLQQQTAALSAQDDEAGQSAIVIAGATPLTSRTSDALQ